MIRVYILLLLIFGLVFLIIVCNNSIVEISEEVIDIQEVSIIYLSDVILFMDKFKIMFGDGMCIEDLI